MRILHVIPSMNPAEGGPMNWTLAASRELNKSGHTSEILTVDDPTSPFLGDLGVTVHAVGPAGRFGYAPQVQKWVADNHASYDFVVVHAIFEHCSYATWRALRGNHDKLVTFPHGMLDPYFNKTYPIKKLKKYLFWNWAIFPQIRDAVVTLFTTEEERMLARQSFRPYSCNERVIAYGITKPLYNLDEAKAAFHTAVPQVGDNPYLLYLSRIHPKKGVDLLIGAFADVYKPEPNTLLVIAGPDQTGIVEGLREQAIRLGVNDRIIWPGMLTGVSKWGAFESCEAFVLPSHQENFGQVVAEAMACGKPVLISDKVNIHQEVSTSGGGLVEPDDLPGTVRLLRGFQALSSEKRAEMGRAAKACFHDKFELEQSVVDFVRVLQEALDSRRPA